MSSKASVPLGCFVLLLCSSQLPGPLLPKDCHAECDVQTGSSEGGYSLEAFCERHDGRCPPEVLDCWWECRLKIMHGGEPIDDCPTANGQIDCVELEANPEAHAHCAKWHLPCGDSPTWSSPSGHQPPPDGVSEAQVVEVLECGGSQTHVYTVTNGADPPVSMTTQLLFECASCP